MTQDELKSILFYCLVTGHFHWMVLPKHSDINVGDRAGCYDKTKGYRRIKINGKLYQEHRLAWLYVHGTMPTHDIDHINGDRSDNRICNLREATHAENQQNRAKHKNNTSGFTGVSFHKPSGKWAAQIRKDGKKYNLGYYDTPELAHAAYLKAKAEFHIFQPVPR